MATKKLRPTRAQVKAAMRILGALGGSVSTPAKAAAARANGRKRRKVVEA